MCRPILAIDKEDGSHCPMCKVFQSTRCRHIRDICTKRDIHPYCDVEYLKNAEVQTFNGCGYCKWARLNPDAQPLTNNGWPGCCRPPAPEEECLIQAADWPAVSVQHQIPVPPQIKSLLDTAAALRSTASKPPNPTISIPRSSSSRKNSPPSSNSSSTPKKRSGSASPRPTVLMPSSLPNGQVAESPIIGVRRNNSSDTIDKSSSHRSSELDSPRRPPISRSPSSTNAVTPSLTPHIVKRRSLNGTTAKSLVTTASPVPVRAAGDKPFATISGRLNSNSKRPILDHFGEKVAPSPSPSPAPSVPPQANSAAAPSERGQGSDSATSVITESTVTSDGGFTDYLSDESDAELQRQAEARAVLAAQNQAEEAEFKAARQQLASIGLKPPKTWHASTQGPTTRLLAQPAMAQAGGPRRD